MTMSLGVALYNDPETIEDLQLLIKILNNLPEDLELPPTGDEEVMILGSGQVIRLVDWLDDIIKILTDFSMFSQEEEIDA